jgi:hypothetical protein
MTDAEFRKRFGSEAVDALLARIRSGKAPEIDPELFGVELGRAGADISIAELLEGAAEMGIVERRSVWRCALTHCRRIIDAEAVANRQCPYCHTDYRETGDEPVEAVVYRTLQGGSRSVPWLIAIHGFNTRAPWQEDFSWRIANRFKYHAPVLIYKYGLVRLGVLSNRRHLMLARDLGMRIQKAITMAQRNQIDEPPDIVIHSFGSQLFRKVLESEEFSALRFGRVIAVGSVIRPDFGWSTYIKNGRIEAVLNHCGGRDRAVPLAQFAIPGTGPGGKRGFSDPSVINVWSDRYGHSTALTEAELADNLQRSGVWDRFLREPLSSFDDPTRFVLGAWSPAPGLVRWIAHAFVIALIIMVSLALLGLFRWLLFAFWPF